MNRDDLDDWNFATVVRSLATANNELRHALRDLAAERRARNIMATLALVGWVLALAALGGAV